MRRLNSTRVPEGRGLSCEGLQAGYVLWTDAFIANLLQDVFMHTVFAQRDGEFSNIVW